MIGCLREAIYARGSWARSHAHFNVVYGTDSASCAHTLEATWRTGDLAAAADSAIGSLVETWLHLRNQLHVLGATFTMFKLPGHGGVYPMAAADACAKACHTIYPATPPLVISSTLGYLEAVPRNPATEATGASPGSWARWAGQPSALVAGTRHFRLLRGRLQEVAAHTLFARYWREHQGGGKFMAVDWAQAGLAPFATAKQPRWTALLKHFNKGVDTYGSEEGAPTGASVAQAVAGGGSLLHGIHVCCCGHEGKCDAYHWLVRCPHGPPLEVRRTAAAILRSISTDILEPAKETPNVCFEALDRAAAVLCERRWEPALDALVEAHNSSDPTPARRGALGAAIAEAQAVGLPDGFRTPAVARLKALSQRYLRSGHPPPLPLPPCLWSQF